MASFDFINNLDSNPPSSGPASIFPIDAGTLKKGMYFSAEDLYRMYRGPYKPGEANFNFVALAFVEFVRNKRSDLNVQTRKQGVLIHSDDQASDHTESLINQGLKRTLKNIRYQRDRVDPLGLTPGKQEIHTSRLAKNHRTERFIVAGLSRRRIKTKERPKDPRLELLKPPESS